MPFVSGFLRTRSGGAIDNELPGAERPVDPDYGIGGDYIDNGLPGGGLPPIGATLPEQPPAVWPPLNGHHPIQPLPPDSTVPPGVIWPPINGAPSQKYWVVIGIPGIGWRYTVIDPSLQVDNELPGGGRVDNTLPPSAQPKG